jgi:trans-aconitate 2-methyltransferase
MSVRPDDAWNPAQYGGFQAERSRPFFDLLALVRPRPEMTAVDLGCGTGELTAELHRELRCASTLGLDASANMLAASAAFAAPGLRFELGDIGRFEAPGRYDLVLSNAALHWVPDHEALFARLAAALAPGGQLAVQIPFMHEHPLHREAAATAREEPFAEELGGFVLDYGLLRTEGYARLLDRLGLVETRVRVELYPHRLASRDELVEWARGSFLTAYEKRLSPATFSAFLERYRERLAEALPDERPFLLSFQRLFLVGSRPPREAAGEGTEQA